MNDVIEQPNTNPESKSNAKIIYILYLVGLIVGITGLVGLVMAYMNQEEAPEWLKSHYQFLIRIFWIGLLYSVIGLILTTIIIGLAILLFVLVWWIVRCVKGLQLLDKQQPIPNPTTWMFS